MVLKSFALLLGCTVLLSVPLCPCVDMLTCQFDMLSCGWDSIMLYILTYICTAACTRDIDASHARDVHVKYAITRFDFEFENIACMVAGHQRSVGVEYGECLLSDLVEPYSLYGEPMSFLSVIEMLFIVHMNKERYCHLCGIDFKYPSKLKRHLQTAKHKLYEANQCYRGQQLHR